MADVTKEIVLEVGLKDSTAQGTTSAKTRLRELQKTLTDMALAGQDGTKAFREMEKEAGKLKDQIGDTQQRIKQLASDTRNIDTFVSAVQGITAGFQIAQGAVALFGDENEDLQKAMLKVQGAMALANGVQQVANLLNKDSILITQGQAAAQALYAAAVGTSTGAMKAFRIALLATGIGAAIAAIGLLIAKWDDLTAAVRRFLNLPDPKQRAAEQEQALKDQEIQLERYRRAYEAHTDGLINADKKRKAARDKAIADRIAENERLAILAAAELQAEADSVAYDKALLDEQTANFNAFAEAYFAESDAILEHDRKNAEERKNIEKAVADYKEQVTSDSIAAIGQILSAFGNENKGIALAALAVEKGAAIANVIINLQKEMAANAVMAAANPANIATAGAAGVAQLKIFNTMAKIRAGLRIAAITAAGIQAGKSITSGGESGGAATGGMMPTGAGGGATNAPAVFGNPNVTDLSGFAGGQLQGTQPMRAYVVERDIQQTTSRVRRLSEFATLG
jgi:hypothetical protein